MEVISSVARSSEEAISSIMKLYQIERFDLDCTYSKGIFWKNLPPPKIKSDLVALSKDVIQADYRKLPFRDEQFSSIMFDPPFVVGGKTYNESKLGSCLISKRFGCFHSFEELRDNYKSAIKELYRICTEEGILVMKTQDTVSSGKQYLSHISAVIYAYEVGFYPIDLFIVLAQSRVNSFNGNKWKVQQHARKYHSYFLVFKKTSRKKGIIYP